MSLICKEANSDNVFATFNKSYFKFNNKGVNNRLCTIYLYEINKVINIYFFNFAELLMRRSSNRFEKKILRKINDLVKKMLSFC